ncbi:amidohydrolase family protein, partial [Vibrio vulnificus]|uniref:amidohydrolase family protein n=2 Tax=Pseudomonadota TaxID=1224 RepID=UPI0039B69AC2
AAGVNTGLGSDGVASNNRLDLFQEMRHAGLMAKLTSGDAAALPADRLLHMATLGGARALGIEHETGSIRPGKSADLCAISLDEAETR